MHFITFNFKRELNFTNIFNAMVDFATVWPTSKCTVECSTVLIFYHTRLSFDFVPPFWCKLELKKHSRRHRGNDSHIRKASLDRCGYDSLTAHQNRENGISWKVSCADDSFPRSQNWSCTSRLLAIAREVENEFRKNTSSPGAQRNIIGTQFQESEGGLL